MELIGKIPMNKIKAIELYQNTRRLTIEQIKSRENPDYIINGGIFSFKTFKPFGNTKADGLVICNPGYTEYGFAWNRGNDISYKVIPSNDSNYLGCVASVLNGKKQTIRCNPDMRGKRQRSAIGISDGALILYACNKSNSKTPESLQNYMIKSNWDSGLMLDGGGSTQAIFPNGSLRSPENNGRGRIVQNYILVYLNNSKHEDITNNKNCPFIEPSSLIRYGSRGEGAKWVQWHLNKTSDSNLKVDGIFGSGSTSALKKFQSNNGLVSDGICGTKTRDKFKDILD